VKLRDASTVNNNIATGEVELVAEELRILNESKLPPFRIAHSERIEAAAVPAFRHCSYQ
jgi:aspartyl-tRNA synthetase